MKTFELPRIEKKLLEEPPRHVNNLSEISSDSKDRDTIFNALCAIMHEDAQKSLRSAPGKENSQLTGALILLNCHFHPNNCQIRHEANPFTHEPQSIYHTSLDKTLLQILSHDKVSVDRGIIIAHTDKFLHMWQEEKEGKITYTEETISLPLDTYILAAGAQFDGFQSKAAYNFGGKNLGKPMLSRVLDLYTTVDGLFNGTKSPTGLAAVYANLKDPQKRQPYENQTAFVLKTTVRDTGAGTGTLLEFNSNGEYREFYLQKAPTLEAILNVYKIQPEQILRGNSPLSPVLERRHLVQYKINMETFKHF